MTTLEMHLGWSFTLSPLWCLSVPSIGRWSIIPMLYHEKYWVEWLYVQSCLPFEPTDILSKALATAPGKRKLHEMALPFFSGVVNIWSSRFHTFLYNNQGNEKWILLAKSLLLPISLYLFESWVNSLGDPGISPAVVAIAIFKVNKNWISDPWYRAIDQIANASS